MNGAVLPTRREKEEEEEADTESDAMEEVKEIERRWKKGGWRWEMQLIKCDAGEQ